MFTVRPFSTFDRLFTLNRVLDDALAGSWNGSTRDPVWLPALDIVERKDAYAIALEVPGVDPSTVDVTFEKNTLTIRGEKTHGLSAVHADDDRVHSAERVTGKFERSVYLPEHVDADNISAEWQHGVLHLTVPKAQAARARKILIKGATA